MDGEHAFATSGGTAWRRQRRFRAFRRYVLWYSKMEIAAAIHHTSRQRTSTTTAATQTVNYASVPAAATCAATASLPVIEHVTPDPAVYTAPAPSNEHVASACVIEYVTPAPVTTLLEPLVRTVFTVQVCHETPQSQTIEKIVEIPQIRIFQGTRASESFGTAPGRHVAFSEIVEVMEFKPPLSVESAPPTFVTTPGVEAGPAMTEYVQPTPVAEYVTPVSAAPAVTYEAPAPVAESFPVPQVPIVEKTIEIPQLQIVEKIVEIPELRAIQGTQTSESLGSAPVRHAAPAELVDTVELVPPSSALSTLPVFVTASFVAEYVQPAQFGDIITDNLTNEEFAQALVPLDTAISQHLGHLKSIMIEFPFSSALLKWHAAGLTPRLSTNVPNMKGDNWRTTLPPPPTWYSASATRLRKSKVACLRFFGSDNACLHWSLLTTASEDA